MCRETKRESAAPSKNRGAWKPLTDARYFIVLPDAIGHGDSSRPSAGLHAKFPHYDYDDMVQAQYLLLIQGLKREPSAAGDGYIHGLHAFVGMAGNLYGLDGRNGLHHQRSRLPMLLPKLLPGALHMALFFSTRLAK